MSPRAALQALVIGLGCFTLPAAETNLASQTAPCPLSKTFRSIEWHWDTYQTAAPGSDLWPLTWGPDDQLYAAWGDGGGFGGSDSDGRVSLGFARIEGDPQHFRGINLNGGKNPLHPASFRRRAKPTGCFSLAGRFMPASICRTPNGHG